MPSAASATPSPHTGPLHLPPTARRSRAAAAGLHLIFDSASDRQPDFCADSPSGYSDASFSSVSSAGPATPLSRSSSPAILSAAAENPDGEDSWNLIPYHVPWGNEYYDYTPGMLPGPDGQCFFLRSPTPLKYKRTVRACTKCRDRKAKCSGDRPACTRCVNRGYICQYDPEEPKRAKGPELARQRLREKSGRTVPVSGAAASGAAAASSSVTVPPPRHRSPKHEEIEILSGLGGLTYPFTAGDAEPWGPAEQGVEPGALEASPDAAAGCHYLVQPKTSPGPRSLLLQREHLVPSHVAASDPWAYPALNHVHPADMTTPPLPASVHAPQPIKRSQVSFLSAPPRAQQPAAPPPIVIPQPPILQATLMPVAEPEPQPVLAAAAEPEAVWQTNAPVALEAFVAYSAQELINGYMAYDYAPADAASYTHVYPPPQDYATQAYPYDMSMYGQGVGVAPAATYVAPAATYVPYAA